MKLVYLVLLGLIVLSCSEESKIVKPEVLEEQPTVSELSTTSIVVLGTTQDAGFPQISCKKGSSGESCGIRVMIFCRNQRSC